jgi:SAM-dependent methyltransferase
LKIRRLARLQALAAGLIWDAAGACLRFGLARMLAPGSTLYAIDKEAGMAAGLTGNGVHILPKKLNFIDDDLGLSALDGILMANAMHYVADKNKFIRSMDRYLKPDCKWLIVEYDTDIPIPRWVPFPLSFNALKLLFNKAGYGFIQKLNERASVYGRSNMYAALVQRT